MDVKRPLSILLSAYACEPNKGSEPGIGWRWACNLQSCGHHVWVVTRANNRAAIEKALSEHSVGNIQFAYYDLPQWLRWWKKGGRGVHLYYFLWQWGAFRLAKRLCQEHRFDLVHHITFGVFRQPSFMAFLNLPFVFGPVGGGESAPSALRRSFPFRGKAVDFLRDVANGIARIDPLMTAVYQRSSIVLCKTRETLNNIPQRYQHKCKLQLEIGTEFSHSSPSPPFELNNAIQQVPLRVLYVGRLVYLKGLHLGISAFARFLHDNGKASLTIVGSGPEEGRLQRLAENLGIAEAITWKHWLSQEEVMRIYPEHDVFLFPSLHDSSGNAVLEALSSGLPVICLNLGGPAALVDDTCGMRVRGTDENTVVEGMCGALQTLANDGGLRQRMSHAALTHAREQYSWVSQTERMNEIYASLID